MPNHKRTVQKTRFPLRMEPTTAKKLEEMSLILDDSMNTIVCQAIDEMYDRFLEKKEELVVLRERRARLEIELAEINEAIKK